MHAMHFIGWSGTRFICAGDLRKRIHRGEIRDTKNGNSTGLNEASANLLGVLTAAAGALAAALLAKFII